MSDNPYDPPKENEAEQNKGRKPWPVAEVFLASIPCGLVLVALAHRLEFSDEKAYITSPLIGFETIGMLVTFLAIPVLVIRAAVLLLPPSKVRQAFWNLTFAALALVALAIAMWIDSPTFMYG